jgi:ATP-binding protein involved in chromosome partitioning
VTFRTYHDMAGPDRSGLAEQVAAQRTRVADRIRAIRHVVAVMSGKGGVGKTYVTAGLAVALAERLPGGVGVLDADLASPTVARMLDARGPLRVDRDGAHPVTGRMGIKVCSTDLLLDEGAPLAWREPAQDRFVWRGALEAGALRELLGDVAWGELDVLLVDLPPGSDRLDDLIELVPDLAGALVVTIPTDESRRSVERAIRRARQAGVRALGVVENMSGYRCADCQTLGPLFSGDAGELLASSFGVPLLCRVPFLPPDPAGSHPAPLVDLAAACLEALR